MLKLKYLYDVPKYIKIFFLMEYITTRGIRSYSPINFGNSVTLKRIFSSEATL